MTKWLRKYSKVLLVVAGVLLMVGFLIQPAMQSFGPNPGRRTVAYTGPNKARAIKVADISLAAVELFALREFLRPVSSGPRGEVLFNILRIDDDPIHWYLLVEEATRAGYVASQTDGNAWISQIAQQAAPQNALMRFAQEIDQRSPGLGNLILQNPDFAPQLDPQRFQAIMNEELGVPPSIGLTESRLLASREQIAASTRLSLEQFDTALTKLRGVLRMVIASLSAPVQSDRRAADTGHRLLDAATIDYLFITGDRLASEVPSPTPDQLDAHWRQYRDTMPGTPPNSIGYLQPPRVRVAWLTIDRAAITASVANWNIATDAVLARWSQFQGVLYPGPFSAERPNVERDIRAAKTDEIADLARRTVVQQVHLLTQRLPKQSGYFTLPADWQTPDLAAIAQSVVDEIARSTGVTITLPPVTILNADWQNIQDLAAAPGIGRSAMRQGAATIPFPQAALAVRELAGDNALAVQTRVPHVEQPLEDAQGNVYFMMVLDSRTQGPADSINEVLDDVHRDYITLQGDALLRARIDSLRSTAVNDGLDALAALFPPENALPRDTEPPAPLTVQREQPISRTPPQGFPPPVGDRDFCVAVVNAARALDPRTPATDQPADLRTVVHHVPSAMGVAVANITWFTPLTLERYRAFAAGNMLNATLDEWADATQARSLIDLAMAPFTLDALKRRWNWTDADPDRNATPPPLRIPGPHLLTYPPTDTRPASAPLPRAGEVSDESSMRLGRAAFHVPEGAGLSSPA